LWELIGWDAVVWELVGWWLVRWWRLGGFDVVGWEVDVEGPEAFAGWVLVGAGGFGSPGSLWWWWGWLGCWWEWEAPAVVERDCPGCVGVGKVGVAGDDEFVVVVGPVVFGAQGDEVGGVGWSAVFPVNDVVDLQA